MKNKWGTYPWFLEHGLEKIHSEDLESFKQEIHNCKIFECINEDDHYITLKYGNKLYRVKNDLFKNVTEPKFSIGQKVKVKDKSDSEAIITDVMWHYDKKEHYYLISVNGKKKSKRYYDSELIE